MIRLRPSSERGRFDHGWLRTAHSFSFADYRDPAHMGFSDLRVINQDWVAPGQGFPTHGHRDMEIITYVYEGALAHRDSMGNEEVIPSGDVQLMSAGSGVTHSEFNASHSEPVELLQMWILPAETGSEPRYAQLTLDAARRGKGLTLVVSPAGEPGTLPIRQDARLHVGHLDAQAEQTFELGPERKAWIHVARGRLRVGDQELGPGDGAAIEGEPRLQLLGVEPTDAVLFDLRG